MTFSWSRLVQNETSKTTWPLCVISLKNFFAELCSMTTCKTMWIHFRDILLHFWKRLYQRTEFQQLNDYETDPYFLQLSQIMATSCLILCFSPFLFEFTCFAPKIVVIWCSEQFSVHNRLIQIRTCKNTKINKQFYVTFWLNWTK